MNYHKSALLIGDDNTEDGLSYMSFTTNKGIQWLDMVGEEMPKCSTVRICHHFGE